MKVAMRLKKTGKEVSVNGTMAAVLRVHGLADDVVKHDLSSLKLAELKALAHTHGIVIHPGAKKADIISTIEHAGRYMRRDMRAIG